MIEVDGGPAAEPFKGWCFRNATGAIELFIVVILEEDITGFTTIAGVVHSASRVFRCLTSEGKINGEALAAASGAAGFVIPTGLMACLRGKTDRAVVDHSARVGELGDTISIEVRFG